MTLHESIKKKIIAIEGNSTRSEVTNTMGRCDIVTDSEIIEVCNLLGYKEGYGRVMAYANSSTFAGMNLKPRLHFFCDETTTFHTFERNVRHILELCKGEVNLTFGNEGVFALSGNKDVMTPLKI